MGSFRGLITTRDFRVFSGGGTRLSVTCRKEMMNIFSIQWCPFRLGRKKTV